jgi:hypothetical protein
VTDRPFSAKTVAILVAAALILLAMSVMFSARGRRVSDPSIESGPGVYSKSALGYAAFGDLLRRAGIPVKTDVSGSYSPSSANPLVIAEPSAPERLSAAAGSMSLAAEKLLLVLPKWNWTPDGERRAWISEAELYDAAFPEAVLDAVDSRVIRTAWPDVWATNAFGSDPSGDGYVQLIRRGGETIRPLIACEEGILLGEIFRGEKTTWVLSDPDIMSNHGIVKGENASLALEIVNAFREKSGAGGAVVFDETIRGFSAGTDGALGFLLKFPFAAVTILTLCAAAIAAWAGVARFGTPASRRQEAKFGREDLIDKSARLLDYGGHHAEVINRYINMTIRSAARALRAPEGMDGPALAEWLDKIERVRGTRNTRSAILSSVPAARSKDKRVLKKLFASAEAIYKWKGEMLIGSSADKRHSQGYKG